MQRVKSAFRSAARFLHGKGKYTPEMLTEEPVRELLFATSDSFSDAVNLGLKKTDLPASMRLYLQDNTFRFAGFKTHREMQAASRLLLDDEGNLKPFNRFLNDVQTIDKTYNGSYLQAEYNFAVASAQSAASWQDFVKDGDSFYLRYHTAGDERVRESHRLLDGITLPPADPFWNEFFPPNDWNCRCSVIQVSKSKAQPSNSSEAIARGRSATYRPNSKGENKAQIFRFNPGKQKVIFPPKHPYLPKNCGDCKYRKLAYDKNKPDCKACKIIHSQSLEEIQKTFQGLEYDEKTAFAQKYLKENKVGKVYFSHPDFGNRKAEFVKTTIGELIKNPPTFDIKFDILFNLEYYLDPNAKLTTEPPKDDKDKARQFFVLKTKYKGANEAFKDKKVEILFRENQNRTINIHFIRLPK